MNPLAFLATSAPLALHLHTLSGRIISVSPTAVGVFTAVLWSVLIVMVFDRGTPYRWYTLMIFYAVSTSLINAGNARFGVSYLSPPVAFATAAFAGAGIGVYLAAPVFAVYRSRLASVRPAGSGALVALPAALTLLPYVTHLKLASMFFLMSSILGLAVAFFLITVALGLAVRLRPRTALTLAVFFVMPELLFASLLPAVLRAL